MSNCLSFVIAINWSQIPVCIVSCTVELHRWLYCLCQFWFVVFFLGPV